MLYVFLIVILSTFPRDSSREIGIGMTTRMVPDSLVIFSPGPLLTGPVLSTSRPTLSAESAESHVPRFYPCHRPHK